jgi:uncharacterized protein YbjT (DUF2867 family)
MERRGERVRCMTRNPEKLRPLLGRTAEVVGADALIPATLVPALRNVKTAYYLIHSLESEGDFDRDDQQAARNFAEAVRLSGVRRIIYLGGLGDAGGPIPLSRHLRSRQETGDRLRESGIPVIELRASIVIGAGSLSFEILLTLVERLPVLFCPRAIDTLAQPIAMDDILAYLLATASLPLEQVRLFEVGGPEPVSYGDIFQEYARQRGLRRHLIRVPFMTPAMIRFGLPVLIPEYARVGRVMAENLFSPMVVRDRSAEEAFSIRPCSLGEAIARALAGTTLTRGCRDERETPE